MVTQMQKKFKETADDMIRMKSLELKNMGLHDMIRRKIEKVRL